MRVVSVAYKIHPNNNAVELQPLGVGREKAGTFSRRSSGANRAVKIQVRNVDEITSPSRCIDLGQICSISNHKS